MAQNELPKGRAPTKRVHRIRSGLNLPQRHNFVGFHGHGLLALILFAILALAVLGVGLALASLTIFAVGRTPSHHAAILHPTPTPTASPSSTSSLVGQPVDGTLVAVWVDQNLVAIQPEGGRPVQATITTQSQITRGGAASSIAALIPGDDVIVVFGQGPHRTLLVQSLQDVEAFPTNTPTALPPTPTPTPSPTAPGGPSPEPSGSPASP
ncbi:MAG: hypothetical protein ACREN4_07375 [Candidatus Dormibacteria bacterium]